MRAFGLEDGQLGDSEAWLSLGWRGGRGGWCSVATSGRTL